MQSLTIDLKKNPAIADLVQTMQPGDYVDLHTSIKALDDQTLTLTVTSADEGEEPGPDEKEETGEGDDVTKPGGDMDMGAPAGGGADARTLSGGETAAT